MKFKAMSFNTITELPPCIILVGDSGLVVYVCKLTVTIK